MHEQEFLDAQAKVERLYKRMGNETVRKVYAYYKQATQGDVSGRRPSAIRFRDRIKFDAWSSISGMSKILLILDFLRISYFGVTYRGAWISTNPRQSDFLRPLAGFA